jgi:hypothetical protein
LSVFEIPELAANVINYILKHPETIARLSMVSKQHYDLLHRATIWQSLGFSSIAGEKVPAKTLKLLLAQIRFDKDNEKMLRIQKRKPVFDELFYRVTADISVDLKPSEQRQLLANNYLTETAAIALLQIIERTLIQPFTLSQLVHWLEQDPLPKVKTNEDWITQSQQFNFPEDYGRMAVDVQYFNNYTPKPGDMKTILTASRDQESTEFSGSVKRYLLDNKNKTLLFLYSSIPSERNNTSVDFVKLDRSGNVIECCGDLAVFAAKKFEGDFNKTLDYLCEVNRSNDKQWGTYFLDSNDICVEEEVAPKKLKNYNKYVAENVQFARSTNDL